MKLSHLTLAIISCLRERQFWHETLREAFYFVTGSSSGIGVAFTATVLGIAHRVTRSASTMVSLEAPGSHVTSSTKTNA
jgi:hypothetical protein